MNPFQRAFHKIKQTFSIPKNAAMFTTINLLLGAGPIIVPAPFFQAGIVLSMIWLILMVFISYNAAMFVAQAMTKCSYLQLKQKSESSLLSQPSSIQSQNDVQKQQENEGQQRIKSFDHVEQFKILYGENYKYVPVVVISIYLLGVSISKCIMTGKTLSDVFRGVPVLQTFVFWLGIFFVSGAIFSFKSIQKTKALQITIILVRFLSIALMIIGAIIIMIRNKKVQSFIPAGQSVFNIDYFGQIFSNLVFSFLFHHSIPGMTSQLKTSSQVSYFIRNGFIISGSIMLIIPITGIMAFGDDLGTGHNLRYYNYDFKGQIDFIYYFVSFYVFLNIAAFSIYIIIIRSNILAIVKPNVNPKVLSKQTLITSVILLTIILITSYFLKDDIQIALSFTGGIFGSIILFFLPCLQVYKARKLANKGQKTKAYLQWLPLGIMGFGGICMVFNLYEIITTKLIKQ